MAQSSLDRIIASLFNTFAYESLTISDSARGLTSTEYTDSNTNEAAIRAVISIEGAQIRYRTDGVDPTATEGHLVNPFERIALLGSSDIKNFKAIRAGTTDATIRVSYGQ